ncbi:glycosyltransferase [Variovorax sp. DXTD-1]|uniref:glycosyltransferase n=1 Tax=Variovorax sp. DXTD-1 TaxID=2495592 RepID=UPI000F8659CF|nr:glycosyltransferase [Variovorax sp. DXTD-1]
MAPGLLALVSEKHRKSVAGLIRAILWQAGREGFFFFEASSHGRLLRATPWLSGASTNNDMAPGTLTALYSSHQGKLSDKWSSYISIYERLFSELKDKSSRILEIGIQNGGSLEIWAGYFSRATAIVGCDINEACRALTYDDHRIHVVVGDANTDQVEEAVASYSPRFDLIIDDGSHRSGDVIRSFGRYFPRLEDGGLFVVEDLHCSYWAEFEGGLFNPASSMAFFKRLADVVNHEHWGLSETRTVLLESFARTYGATFDEELLGHIHAIEFLNSVCVIRKKTSAENRLGTRVISGQEAIVDSGLLALHGSGPLRSDQLGNAWSKVRPLPEDELAALRVLARDLDAALAARTAELRDARKAALYADIRSNVVQSHVHQLRGKSSEAAREVQQLFEALQTLRTHTSTLESVLNLRQSQVDEILNSTSWRVTKPLRWVGLQKRRVARAAKLLPALSQRAGGFSNLARRGVQVLSESGLRGVRSSIRAVEAEELGLISSPAPDTFNLGSDPFEDIARQIYAGQQAEFAPREIFESINRFEQKPMISVIMPVYKTPVQWLARAIESLQEQFYDNWELCAVDDCSPTADQRKVLEQYARNDPRVRYRMLERNSGIAAASNAGLEMAQGEFIALLDHDDELPGDALFWAVDAINKNPHVDFIYTDECKIDDTSERRLFDFIFKPDWSPEILFNSMLTGHLTVYKKDVVNALGGFRSQYNFSQDYDLALRMAEVAREIVHIERVLYLWRSIPGSAASGGKDFARESNIAALDDALVRRGIQGKAKPLPHANYVEVVVPKAVKVSIVIPSDSFKNLNLALNAILEKTDYPNYEVVVVCNGPLAEQLEEEFRSSPHIGFLPYNKKYNFSDKCNEGARAASGEIVVFYNDDVFPAQADWIEKLIEYLSIAGVGGVSPKLLHEDETIQYAGMISGTPGLCGTAYNNLPREATDSFLSMHKYVRNVSILSGACCALKTEVFWRIGGFDPINTPDGHSDMDLSYKLLEAGYRCVYTPHAVLYHIGNHSWGAKAVKYKADIYALKRWGAYLSKDPNFTDSMKKVLYRDFRFTYKIFASHIDASATYTGPDVLFVSHELSLTGAPRMLLCAAVAVLRGGGFPVVVAPEDGPMRRELEQAGVVVIVDESLCEGHFLFERFARNFDAVVVNTMAVSAVVRQVEAIDDLDVIWWLHEGRALQTVLEAESGIDRTRVRLLCVSEYARAHLPADFRADVLYNGIPDRSGKVQKKPLAERCTFVLAGTVEHRKGQDLFAEAILLLPEDVRASCRFLLTGKLSEQNMPFWSGVRERMGTASALEYLGLLNHSELLDLLASADAVVCCSRDEAFSLVVVEAAMLSKPSIINPNVGVAEILQHKKSCLLFEAENAASLAEQMLAVFHDRGGMSNLGLEARKVYEERFTIDRFSEEFLRLVR